jgi:hypothetical protein
MKFIIFGGGPCGMRLTDNLSRLGHQVELHEKKEILGGCWRVEWKNGYFTEHSPRVMTDQYKLVLELVARLGLEDPYRPVYGGRFETTWKFLKYSLKNLSIFDNIKFMNSLLTISKADRRNMQEWIDESNITNSGKKGIYNLCVSLQSVPKDVSAYAFFDAIYGGFGKSEFIQFREGDRWLKVWEEDLRSRKGVKIVTNSELIRLETKGRKIVSAMTNGGKISGDHFLCSFPLWNFQEMIQRCNSPLLRNNWMEEEMFIKYCKDSSYSAIGVQLHFDKKMNLDMDWCQTCMGDWSIVMLETSKFTEDFTKKKDIVEVWSLALVDFTKKSKRLDKTLGKLDYKEIIEEVLFQLEMTLNRKVKPKTVTINVDINDKGKWELRDSAFSITPKGPVEPKGQISNLFLVGCQNQFKIAILDGALESADNLVSRYF